MEIVSEPSPTKNLGEYSDTQALHAHFCPNFQPIYHVIGKDTFTLRTADPQALLTQEKRVVFLSRAGKHLATENVSLKRRIPVSLHLLRKVTYTACRTRCRNNGNLALPYITRLLKYPRFTHFSWMREAPGRLPYVCHGRM